ncbi:MAG: hypothetical protein WCS52_18835 [bacterium]|jgi:hypothetical protein
MTKKIKSRWVVTSDDSRYIINREKDGGVILLDCAVIDPNDAESSVGLFYISPDDAPAFLSAMKTAIALDEQSGIPASRKTKAVKAPAK